MPSYKITKQQFECFRREVLKWVREFGLTDFDVEIKLEKPTNSNADASNNWNISGCWSVIALSPIWEHNPSDKELKRIAFHEVAHLLMAPMFSEATNRFVQEDILNKIEEATVVRLENFYRRNIQKEKI